MPKIKHVGPKMYRFHDNPMEEKASQAWEKLNEQSQNLAYLLGDGQKPVELTQDQATVAASVIQWLGSPCGQHFVANLFGEKGLKDLAQRIDTPYPKSFGK